MSSLILTEKPLLKEPPRNRRAPEINPRLQEQLTRIGGTVPEGGGPHAGKPVFRLAFGQEETHFCRGKERLRFPDGDVEPVMVQERFFVAPEMFARAAEWQRERDKSRIERFLNFDYNVFGEHENLSGYLKQCESSLNYIQLQDCTGSREELSMDVLGIASTAAPKDWIYLCDIKEVIEIGKNCWFIMRWIPSSSHGGRKAWNDMRYTSNAYVPEINNVVPIIDDLGEFPEYGFYIPCFEIAEYPEDESGELNAFNYQYTEPVEANTVEPVIQELYEQAQLSVQERNKEYRAKKHNDHLIEKRDAGIKKTEARICELLEVDSIEVN